jgi:hypothetical protein
MACDAEGMAVSCRNNCSACTLVSLMYDASIYVAVVYPPFSQSGPAVSGLDPLIGGPPRRISMTRTLRSISTSRTYFSFSMNNRNLHGCHMP